MARKKKIAGITIELDGDATPLKKALGEVDKASQKSEKELSAINRALKFDEGNTTLIAQKFEVLEESIQQTSKRLDHLKDAKVEVDKEFAAGNIDASAYREFIREIEKTESKLKSFKSQSDDMKVNLEVQADTSALDKVESRLSGLGDKARQAGKEIGDGIATGAAAGAAALGGLAIAGDETAGDLGRMNAVLANLGFDNTKGQFDTILANAAAVTGEMDSAVEAIVNLANTDMSQSQLEKTMEHLTGAAIQFSDTLKLEGLADGLQETLAVGAGAGSFIEYLERSGINLEEFNKGLEVAKGKGEELDYVLGVMSATGGQSFLDTYKEMNSVMFENQQAKADLQIATARLSEALAPLLTHVINVVTAIISWLAENEKVAQILAVLLTIVGAVGAVIAALAPIITLVGGSFAALSGAIGAIAGPIALFVAGIISTITIIGLWIKVITSLPDIFGNVFEKVKSTVGFLVDEVKEKFTSMEEFFGGLWEGIVSGFESAVEGVKLVASSIIGFLKAPINEMIELVNKFIRSMNDLEIPDWVPFAGGKSLNIPEIPMLAKGTDYFRGGMAIVGEQGPELVEMPTGAKVHTAKETANMLGGNGGTVQITVPLSVDGRVLAQAIATYNNRELYASQQRDDRGR